MVGSGTVEAEDYRPVTLDDERRERRLAAGLSEVPLLAIVSGRLGFDPEARVFSDPEHRPMVITGPDAEPAKLALLGDSADVVFLDEVTPTRILERLGAAGIILCEGGPTLVGQLVAVVIFHHVKRATAARWLDQRISGTSPGVRREVLPTRLVIRTSCGPHENQHRR